MAGTTGGQSAAYLDKTRIPILRWQRQTPEEAGEGSCLSPPAGPTLSKLRGYHEEFRPAMHDSGRGKGRLRKPLSKTLFLIQPVIFGFSVWMLWRFFHNDAFRESIESSFGWEDEAFPQQFFIVAGVQALMVAVGYVLTLDPRAKSRPWVSMNVGAAFAGATAAAALHVFNNMKYAFQYDRPTGATIMMMMAGAAAGAAVISIFEGINRWFWNWLVNKMDAKGLGGTALWLGRLSLLWRPGQDQLLKSVTMERFRRGARDEVADQLRELYRAGDRNADLLELLCQLAAEERQPAEYLEYLQALFTQFPDDAQLRGAYLAELLEQGKTPEALALMEKYGVEEAIDPLDQYAKLLLEAGRLDRAVEVARKLGQLEGIPMRRGDAVLREVLARDGERLDAVNLLYEHAERMARKDQQVRWLEKSLALNRKQPEKRRKLLQLLEDAGMNTRVEEMLAEMVADSPGDLDLGLRHAKIVYSNGKTNDALETMERLHERGSRAPDLLELMAKVYYEQRSYTDAQEMVAEALEKFETLDPERRDNMLALGRRVERAQFSAELAAMIEKANQQPEDLELLLTVIDKLNSEGQHDRVVGFGDVALRHHPAARARIVSAIEEHAAKTTEGAFLLLNYVADLQVADGRYDAALETIQTMAARSLDPVSAIRDGAQKILRRSPHHLATLRVMGRMYHDKGQFTEMIHAWTMYQAHGGEETPEISRALANAYLSLNDYKSAKKHLISLLRLEQTEESISENVELLKRVIPMASAAGDANEAAEFLLELEKFAPNDREARKLREDVNESLGRARIQFLKRELEAGKGDKQTLEELGDMCREAGDFNEAITYYQRAARQGGPSRRPIAKLAFCFARKRMYDLAGENLGELKLSLDDDPAELDELMTWVYKTADVLEEARMLDIAAKLFKQLMKVDAGYKDVLQRVERLTNR